MTDAVFPSGASVVGTLALPAALASVPAARKFAVGCIAESVADATEDACDAVALLTAELVTNAVLHAVSPVVVTVASVPGQAVRVAVHDEDGRAAPTVHHHAADASTGRGMRLVAAMSSEWGVDLDAPPRGKTVWFEVPLAPDSEAAEAAFAAQWSEID